MTHDHPPGPIDHPSPAAHPPMTPVTSPPPPHRRRVGLFAVGLAILGFGAARLVVRRAGALMRRRVRPERRARRRRSRALRRAAAFST